MAFGTYDPCANFFKPQKQPKEKKRYRLKPVADKKKDENRRYAKLKKQYLKDHPICEFEGCSKKSAHVHHKKRRGRNLCKVETFMACCAAHHRWIEDNGQEAESLGYLIRERTVVATSGLAETSSNSSP